MKAIIMGTPVGSGNRGVLALGASLVGLCSTAFSGAEVMLLLLHRNNDPAAFRIQGKFQNIPVIHARMSPRTHFRHHFYWVLLVSLLYRLLPFAYVRELICRSTPWIRAVARADLVGDIRGGDSFSDIYGFKRFLLGFLQAWSVLLVKGTMVQFPQTYGPYKSPIARWLARFLLNKSSVIIARDRQSQKVAQDLVGPEKEVLLSPDVAFSLDPVQPADIQTSPPLEGSIPRGVIGLNVNGLMFNGGYSRQNMFGLKMDYPGFLQALIPALLAEHPGEVWLVPHTYAPPGHVESDNGAAAQVRDSLPPVLRERVRVVTGEYDQHEIKWIIGQCGFFVGSRMHSCIAALSQGVPCVGVAYSMKFAGVFESVGMNGWVVDGRTATNEEAVARILDLYRQREVVRHRLGLEAGNARVRLKEVFRNLVRAPETPSSSTPADTLVSAGTP